MLTSNTIRTAMKLLKESENTNIYSPEGKLLKTFNDQIALSLKVYLDRGEYQHGNFQQAKDCLRMAEYEISD